MLMMAANTMTQTLWTSSEAETSAAGQAEAPKEDAPAATAEEPAPAAQAEEPKAE